MAQKFNTHGAQLQLSDGGSPAQYATVAQLESITLHGETRGSEQVPTHDDAAGSAVPIVVDALVTLTPVTFTVVEDLTDPTHDDTTGLMSVLRSTTPVDVRVVLANGVEIDYIGWFTSRTAQAQPANRGVARADYEFLPIDFPTITQPGS